MAQFGINGDPKVATAWRSQGIPDDPVKQSNGRGFLSFAMAGPNTRTTQLFINYGDNARLDRMGFSPFARVIKGMDIVDQLYSGYGEGAPQGKGPDQARIQREGNAYLNRDFPKLDYVKKAVVID
jgi:peptidyl-prolyl cis-trans isomerase A (cyclophilin A)